MANVVIDFGPAGSKGVQSIMGVGAADFEAHPVETLLTRAAWASIGVWGCGVVFGSKTLRQMGLGGAAVGFGVRYLGQKQLDKPAETLLATPAPPLSGFGINPSPRRRRRFYARRFR